MADKPFDITFSLGWDGYYRPMNWTPVEIDIVTKGDKPFGGILSLTAQQDGLTTMTVNHHFALTPDMPFHAPLITKLAYMVESCSVDIANENGRHLQHDTYELMNYNDTTNPLTAVMEKDLLIGHVGRWQFGITQLAKQTQSVTSTEIGEVFIKSKQPSMVPWDWTGFVSLDALILYDPDWTSLRHEQSLAISQWVTNGGKLLVVLGTNPLPSDSIIANMLPLTIGKPKTTTIPQSTLNNWGLNANSQQAVTCWQTDIKAQSENCQIIHRTPETPLFICAEVGFGRVGILTFDPSALKNNEQTQTAKFWASHLSNLLGKLSDSQAKPKQKTQPNNMGFYNYSHEITDNSCRTIEYIGDREPDEDENEYQQYNYMFQTGLETIGLNNVLEYLLSISELKPLSIWWVILLLGMLTILLGPVDYLMLKKIDRLPLTWITSSLCIAAFTVCAYFGVHALRSGEMQLRAVSVIDGIKNDTNSTWSTTHIGLFAPKTKAYKLEGIQNKQWWSAAAPSEDVLYDYRRETGSRRLYCVQHDGSNTPISVPINIWSMQCLVSETPQEQMPIEATVFVEGDKVSIEIKNLLDQKISSGYVRVKGDRQMTFGEVAGNSTANFSNNLRGTQKWSKTLHYLDTDSGEKSIGDDPFFAQGTLQRTRGILRLLENGAAVVCVRYDDAKAPVTVEKNKSEINHTQLVRLVVFPEKGL